MEWGQGREESTGVPLSRMPPLLCLGGPLMLGEGGRRRRPLCSALGRSLQQPWGSFPQLPVLALGPDFPRWASPATGLRASCARGLQREEKEAKGHQRQSQEPHTGLLLLTTSARILIQQVYYVGGVGGKGIRGLFLDLCSAREGGKEGWRLPMVVSTCPFFILLVRVNLASCPWPSITWSCREAAAAVKPRASAAAGGGGAGPGAGRPDSNLGCRGCAVAARGPVKIVWAASAGRPPIRTAHRPVLRRPRSRGSNWEHKCPAFLLLLSFFFTNLKEILLWTDPCLPLS